MKFWTTSVPVRPLCRAALADIVSTGSTRTVTPGGKDDSPKKSSALLGIRHSGHIIVEKGDYMVRQVIDATKIINDCPNIYGDI